MKYPKIIVWILIAPLLLMNTQCDEDDLQSSDCGVAVIVDNTFYEAAVSDSFDLVDFDLEDDCLTVEVAASGCDGESWSLVLVDSGAVAESLPEQRFLKLVFTNEEECLAVISQSRVFNLTGLRVEGSNEVVLNIEGILESINYMYP